MNRSNPQSLMILRHAKAVPWSPAAEDFPRKLSQAGVTHARNVATWVHEHQLTPDQVLCSPAQRTRETLAPLLALQPGLEATVEFLPSLYGASVATLHAVLDAAFAERDRVMLVGHNPGLEMLAFDTLSTADRQGFKRLPTGTLLVVEFPNGWSSDEGRGHLQHKVRGKKL